MKHSKILVTLCALTFATLSLSAAEVKETYEASCQKCHGADGKGATTMGKKTGAKDWTDPAVQSALTDEKLATAIKEGVKEDGKTKMKAYDDLSDADIKALVTYIRAFKK